MGQTLDLLLNIRYVKLKFVLRFPEDTILPENKPSAIRGGIGEMLLRANCIRDRHCESCDFSTECIVQRMMYSKLEIQPEFMTQGDSVGYVIACEDYRSSFSAGDTFSFYLTLFGKSICYFAQYVNAIFALGQNGLGRNHSHFLIAEIVNQRGKPILQESDICMENYQIDTVRDYVENRMRQIDAEKDCQKIVFFTGLTQKYRGEYLQEFQMNAIIKSVMRRLYVLDCFEGIEAKDWYENASYEIPLIIRQHIRHSVVERYSNRKNQKVLLKGIRGELEMASPDAEVLRLLLAGELMHIGKNTSFGFGRYRIV